MGNEVLVILATKLATQPGLERGLKDSDSTRLAKHGWDICAEDQMEQLLATGKRHDAAVAASEERHRSDLTVPPVPPLKRQ